MDYQVFIVGYLPTTSIPAYFENKDEPLSRFFIFFYLTERLQSIFFHVFSLRCFVLILLWALAMSARLEIAGNDSTPAIFFILTICSSTIHSIVSKSINYTAIAQELHFQPKF